MYIYRDPDIFVIKGFLRKVYLLINIRMFGSFIIAYPIMLTQNDVGTSNLLEIHI